MSANCSDLPILPPPRFGCLRNPIQKFRKNTRRFLRLLDSGHFWRMCALESWNPDVIPEPDFVASLPCLSVASARGAKCTLD